MKMRYRWITMKQNKGFTSTVTFVRLPTQINRSRLDIHWLTIINDRMYLTKYIRKRRIKDSIQSIISLLYIILSYREKKHVYHQCLNHSHQWKKKPWKRNHNKQKKRNEMNTFSWFEHIWYALEYVDRRSPRNGHLLTCCYIISYIDCLSYTHIHRYLAIFFSSLKKKLSINEKTIWW